MSESAPGPSLSQRLGTTPMRDLLRGRLTGRLDWRSRLRAAGLPSPAADLIEQVVQRTRLWGLEKGEVADELIAHFLDGLTSGTSAAALVDSFGDAGTAARLIRRSKIRNRPLAWHVVRWSARVIGAVVLLYTGMTLYFLAGRPSIAVDYVAALNRPVEQTPLSQRAWSVYRPAFVQIHAVLAKLGPEQAQRWEVPDLIPTLQPQIAQLRRAAAMPILGFVFGPNGSQEDPVLFPRKPHSVQEFAYGISDILLPHLNELRFGADLLAQDARAAAQQHDPARFYADWVAVHSMARQLQAADAFLISDFVAVSLPSMADEELSRYLADQPDAWDDGTLVTIAHSLSRPHVAADLVHFGSQQIYIDDCIQRMYTDDGHGDGRMTLPGLRYLWSLNTERHWPPDPWDQLWNNTVTTAMAPASVTVVASRREVTEKAKQILSDYQQAASVPLRDADLSATSRDFEQLHAPLSNSVRFAPLVTVMFPFYTTAATAERYLGQRDGIEVAIALTLYHRQHRAYPDVLDELTPKLLPSVPADRITGDPLKYHLNSGKPIIYSVGSDRIDDGGHYPTNGHGQPAYWAQTAQWGPAVDPHIKGDWILFPPPPPLPTAQPATQQ